jgi:hypothetical protein
MYGYIELPAVQNGTNCRSCRMTRSDCEFADEGEVDVRCCDQCNHPKVRAGHVSDGNPLAAAAMRPDGASGEDRDGAEVRRDRDVRSVREPGGQVGAVTSTGRTAGLRGRS